VRILDPGLLTTVQDLGRFGFGKDGVSPSGAMDPDALRAANLIVDGDQGAAGLEMTSRGPRIEFSRRALLSICGADLCPQVAGVPLPCWRAIYVQEGAVLELGTAHWGCRAYLAVAGGIELPEVLRSRSTYLRAGIGGLGGRALRAGDELPVGGPSVSAKRAMWAAARGLGPFPFALAERFLRDPGRLYRPGDVRFVRGPHWDMMDEHDRKSFVGEAFEVSLKSDRMGYRLSGPALRSVQGAELISTAVLTGTVQVPPGGEPIVLMADRQTTGGYPMVAHVIRADLGTVAQLEPGDPIRFREVTIDEAQRALREKETIFDELRGV
jgi:antagonist of KipI